MSLASSLLLMIAYLLGSIPFGLLLTRMAGGGDIRAVGSGNIGATNVLRTGKKSLALLTLLLDGLKGALAIWTARAAHMDDMAALAGAASVLGHMFPVWLRGRGGKGVATVIGVWLALYWPLGVVAIGAWLIVFLASRYSSLSSLVAVIAAAGYAYGAANGLYFIVSSALAVLVVLRHHANLRRLWRGEEMRFTQRS